MEQLPTVQLPQDLFICLGTAGSDPGTSRMEQGMNSDYPAHSGTPNAFRLVVITDNMVREAIQTYMTVNCCCGRRSAGEELVITELTQMPIYRYRLQSFTETRHSEKICKPYTGQRIDGPEWGDPPQLWDVVVQTPKMFHEGSKSFTLPHSAAMKVCHKCRGRKRCKCTACGGSGQFRCRCSGASRQRSRGQRCHACSGSGRRRCSKCSGRGRKACVLCRGEGRLLHYQQVKVTWRTLQSELLSKPPALGASFPLNLLQGVTGEVMLQDDDVMIPPVAAFAESPETTSASDGSFRDSRTSGGSSCRILSQHKTVEMIPVARVQYEYRGQSLSSYVYGREHRVYRKQNPHTLLCGCTVM